MTTQPNGDSDMTQAQHRVIDMVSAGKVSPAEGDLLMAAMTKSRRLSWRLGFIWRRVRRCFENRASRSINLLLTEMSSSA